ncbi:MAG: hypothetical protein IPK25_05780 [Saprospiraceae bacterium]|nr:hypothetical protein [Saprospiraceae bacterium]
MPENWVAVRMISSPSQKVFAEEVRTGFFNGCTLTITLPSVIQLLKPVTETV